MDIPFSTKQETKKGFQNVAQDINQLQVQLKEVKESIPNVDDLNTKINQFQTEQSELYREQKRHTLELERIEDKITQLSQMLETLSQKTIDLVKVMEQPKSAPKIPQQEDVTVAEKQILYILASNELKLSYKDIAVIYGRSISTIKTLLTKLKSKNIPIQETNDATGTKRFFLDESLKASLLQK